MKKQISLAASVAWISAFVIVAAMLVYAIFQYFTMPDMPLWRLLVEHTWHVLVLGGLSYGVLQFLLHKKVVEPMRQLYVKLYRISRGDGSEITVKTNIREVQNIAESVNLMLAQLDRTSHEPWVGKLRANAGILRALSGKEPGALDNPDREMLVRTATELEELAVMFERFEARIQNLDHEL